MDGGQVFDKRYLLYGGILNFILYLSADIIGGLLTPDYVFREHAVSELMLDGAEHRTLISAIVFSSSIAGIAFGIGFLLYNDLKSSRALFLAGILLTLSGISTAFTSTIWNQDARGGEVTFGGTMHLVLVGVNVLITIITMLLCGIYLNRKFGWKTFRLLSFLSLIIMAVGGVVSTIFIQNDIPWLGVSERIPVYSYFVWNAALAWLLLKEGTEPRVDEPSIDGPEEDPNDDVAGISS